MVERRSFKEYLKDLPRLRSSDASRFFLSIESYVNNLSFKPIEEAKAILSNKALADNMRILSLAWVAYVGTNREALSPDGRNERSVFVCESIVSVVPNLTFFLANKQLLSYILKTMPRMHRTLMQTFTGVVLSYIHQCDFPMCNDIDRAMSELLDRDWYVLPLI